MHTFSARFFLCSLVLFCFTPLVSAQQDRAERVLEQSKEKFESLDNFTAEFTYTIYNPTQADSRISRSGELTYSDKKFIVKLADQHFYCNGETVWIYSPEFKEVNIMNYDEGEGLDLNQIFSMYENSTRLRYDGIEEIGGKDVHHIYLTATDPELEYNQAHVWINKRTELLEKAITINRMQTRTVYEFQNYELNQDLPDNHFEFDVEAYPEVEVFDER